MSRKILIGSISLILFGTLVVGLFLFNYLNQIHKKSLKIGIEKKQPSDGPQMPESPQKLTTPSKPEFVKGEMIVKYKGEKLPKVEKIPVGANVMAMAAQTEERSDIEYAEPNYIAYALFSPNDPYYKFQWNFYSSKYKGVGVPDAWDKARGEGVVVAVVDSGIAYENYDRKYKKAPDLGNTKFVKGYDFVNDDAHPNDDNGHGTHLAGTIAQSTNNRTGVAGIAYKATLMPVKVLDSKGTGEYEDIAEGIRYAADNGADVINLSLGGPSESEAVRDAVEYAYSKGAVIVAASGNNGEGEVMYPAALDDYVIAVGAVCCDGALAEYSNWGESIDIVAPGGDKKKDQNKDGYGDGILQQTIKNKPSQFGYFYFQGTSMATAHVSGVAALVESLGVTDPDEVRSILEETAQDKGSSGQDDRFGHGVVDAAAAVKAAANSEKNCQK